MPADTGGYVNDVHGMVSTKIKFHITSQFALLHYITATGSAKTENLRLGGQLGRRVQLQEHVLGTHKQRVRVSVLPRRARALRRARAAAAARAAQRAAQRELVGVAAPSGGG